MICEQQGCVPREQDLQAERATFWKEHLHATCVVEFAAHLEPGNEEIKRHKWKHEAKFDRL